MTHPDALATARQWLSEAEHILIGAGAGLTAAAGLDYGDKASFARVFPAFVKRGYSAQYQFIGDRSLPPEAYWGFWSTHVRHVRFGPGPHPIYARLLELVRKRDHFVLTSNVDALFERNGFQAKRLFTPQGDYARMQCMVPCSAETWETRPSIDRMLATLDPVTQEVTDAAALPQCPRCGGEAFMNVRLNHAFSEKPYVAQAGRFADWAGDTVSGRLVVLEFGAGFNTPSVVRWRLEHLVQKHPDARLVRVNLSHPEVPKELGDRAVSVRASAGDVIEALVKNG